MKRTKKPINWNRFGIYFFAFTFPPIFIGILSLFLSAKDVMIQKEPEPLEASTEAIPNVPPLDPSKKNVMILVSNSGTQSSELLGSFAAFAEDGRFNVYTVAPKIKLSHLTASIAVRPHYDFKTAPAPEILVVPSVLDTDNPLMTRAVQTLVEKVKFVVVLGEGSTLLAKAGLLNAKPALTHFNSFENTKKALPRVKWVRDRSYFVDGKFFHTLGISRSYTDLLEAIRAYDGKLIDERSSEFKAPKSSKLSNFFFLYMHAGFRFWDKRNIGVLIFNGVDERLLAATFDTYPRDLRHRVVSFGEKRVVYQSKHGLFLVPTLPVEQIPALDSVIIKRQDEDSLVALKEPKTEALIGHNKIRVVKNRAQLFPEVKADWGYYSALTDMGMSRRGSQFIRDFIHYPYSPDSELPWIPALMGLLLRPFFIGLFGIFFARIVINRLF